MPIGTISARYESRGKPYQTPPPTGEQSYGTFQLLGDPPSAGKDLPVMQFLKASGYYETDFAGLTLNSAPFKEKWEDLGKNDPGFAVAQYRYISETHFYPLAAYAEKKGLPRTTAVDEALFSIGVQHGRARKILNMALSTLDLKTASEADIVNALYDARTNYVKKLLADHLGREEDLNTLIEKRYPEERKAVLDLVKNKSTVYPTFAAIFEQLGLDSDEAQKAAAVAEQQNKFNPQELSARLNSLLEWYKKNPIAGAEEDTEENTDGDNSDAPAPPPSGSSAPPVVPPNREEEYKSIGEFVDFIGDIGKLTGSSGLQKTANAFKYVMAGYEAISKLSALTGSISMGAVAGPIGMLGGALVGIIGLFAGGGPDINQIILNQLQHLSEQLYDVKRYISQVAEAIFENQKTTYEAICKGFYMLHVTLDNQFSSLRLDLDERLDKISAAALYIARKVSADIKELPLLELRQYYTEADTWINTHALGGNPAEAVPNLVQKLFDWILSTSAPLFTGVTNYGAAAPPDIDAHASLEVLKDTLYGERHESRLNHAALTANLIGYLASYYQAKGDGRLSSTLDVSQISNPQMWYDITQKYIALKQTSLQFDNASTPYQLQKIRQAGATFNHFINTVEGDQNFWSYLYRHYYDLSLQLRNSQIHFIKAYSATYRKQRSDNAQHPFDSIDPFTQTDWDFITEPTRLIQLMSIRGIDKVVNFTNHIGAINTKPITGNFYDWLAQPLIAAEYLGLVYFSAEQNGEIGPAVFCINPIRDAEFNEVDGKLNERGGKHQDGDTVIGKAGMEVLRKVGTNERVTEWTLPLKLFLSSSAEGWKYEVGEVIFTGSLAQLAVETNFWIETDGIIRIIPGAPMSHVPGIPVYKYKYSSPNPGSSNYSYDVPAGIPDYVKSMWNASQTAIPDFVTGDANQASLKFTGHGVVTHPQTEQVKALLDAEFLKHRKIIAHILKTGVDNATDRNPERQTWLSTYRNTLMLLDIHVKLMQFFAYLMGKDDSCPFFKKLHTTESVQQFWDIFESTSTTQTSFTHSIIFLSDLKKEISNLPELSDVQAVTHPRQLFAKAIVSMETYEQLAKARPPQPQAPPVVLLNRSNPGAI